MSQQKFHCLNFSLAMSRVVYRVVVCTTTQGGQHASRRHEEHESTGSIVSPCRTSTGITTLFVASSYRIGLTSNNVGCTNAHPSEEDTFTRSRDGEHLGFRCHSFFHESHGKLSRAHMYEIVVNLSQATTGHDTR